MIDTTVSLRIVGKLGGRGMGVVSQHRTIYDTGEEDGPAFLVMEFLDGMTLKHAIGGKALEPKQVLALG